jgi:mono/diheme cytochrome c family protein
MPSSSIVACIGVLIGRCAIALAIEILAATLAFGQSPQYHVGRSPTPEEIKAEDIAIGPDGRELPPGRGDALRGKQVYAAQCARCHGATAREGPEAPLVGGIGSLNTNHPVKTVGSYWPYATTLWDYVNRAMPFDRPGILSADDVYATVAYVLFLNGIVGEQDTLDQRSLVQVAMANRNGFESDPRPDVHTPGKPVTPAQRKQP